MAESSFYGDTPNYATDYPTQNDSNSNPVAGNTPAPSSFYPNGGGYVPLAVADDVLAEVQSDAAAAAASASAAASSAASAAAVVQAAAGTATPLVDGTAAVGTGVKWAREDHRHPTDTSRLAVSGNLSDVASKPTAFDNIAPTTTRGDLIARGASANQRLELGISGYALLSNGTDPEWAGFLEAGTGAVARTWQDKGRDFVSVKGFGAVGNNSADDTVAIQAAINAIVAAGGGTLYIPKGIYKISSTLTVTSPISIVGDGSTATIIRQTNASAHGIVFGYASLTVGGSIRYLTIEAGAGFQASGFQGTGSSGGGLIVQQANGGFVSSSICVNNFTTGISVDGCWYSRHFDFQILYHAGDGFRIGGDLTFAHAGGNLLAGGKISNLGFSGVNTNSNGIRIRRSGGEYLQFVDVTNQSTGVRIDPNTGDHVFYLFAVAVLADTNVDNGWFIDGTLGAITSLNLTECWGAFCSGGNGFVIAGSNIDCVELVGCRARENGGRGIYVTSGVPKNIHILGGEVAQNSQFANNTIAGIEVDVSTSIQIVGVRAGNFASGLPNTQAEGIKLSSGVTGQVIGCNLTNAGSGKSPIAYTASASADLALIGNRPALAAANRNTGVVFSGCTTATVATNTTTFLGANAANTNLLFTSWSVGRPALVTAFNVAVDNAPGVGQTFTYELWKNGASTGMTGTISGSGAFSVTVQSPTVALSVFDSFSIKLITSNGAAAANHRYSVYLDT